jgi:integrase
VGENPARWKGHLSLLLPKRHKLTRGHHPAMPFDQVSGLIARLRQSPAVSALALEFTILTAVRTSESIGAVTTEFDLDERVWQVPATRAKPGRILRVPLSSRAIQIVRGLWPDIENGHIFRSPKARSGNPTTPLSNMAMLELLHDLGEEQYTVHGFRSSFRDWVGECTTFPREVAEAALGHAVGNEVEQAYRRGDALANRRRLMDAWARYCEPEKSAKIIAVIG